MTDPDLQRYDLLAQRVYTEPRAPCQCTCHHPGPGTAVEG